MELVATDNRESQPLMLDCAFKRVLHLYPTGGVESQPIFLKLPILFPDGCAVLALLDDGTAQLAINTERRVTLDVPQEAVKALLVEFLAAVTINVPDEGMATIACEVPALQLLDSKDFASALLAVLPEAAALLSLKTEAGVMIDVSVDARASLDVCLDAVAVVDAGECTE